MTSIPSITLEVPDPTAKKSLWGYGGTVQAPDGAIWKVATSSKKNTGPVSPDGTGSHRIAIVSDLGPFTDPDGFVWEGVRDPSRRERTDQELRSAVAGRA